MKTSIYTLLLLSTALALTGCKLVDDDQDNPSNWSTESLLTEINQVRAQARYCGDNYYPAAPALKWSAHLQQAAKAHSQDMAAHNFFEHVGSDGLHSKDRVQNTGAPYSYVGENIFAGKSNPKDAIKGWVKSAGHCANLMNPNYQYVAMAHARNASSQYKDYWTQVFAAD